MSEEQSAPAEAAAQTPAPAAAAPADVAIIVTEDFAIVADEPRRRGLVLIVSAAEGARVQSEKIGREATQLEKQIAGLA